ncbi:MAG: hypothetical protein WC476_12175 [Phycisphaerae bacterium]|jgi:hypothetical protein
MSIRKGITRIIILAIWLSLCAAFALSIFHSLGPEFAYRYMMLPVSIFFFGFYGITVASIVFVDLTRPSAEQWWDPWSPTSKVILWIALIAGCISFGIFSQLESLQRPYSIAPYLTAFVLPFGFIIGNYIIICWLVDGFRG